MVKQMDYEEKATNLKQSAELVNDVPCGSGGDEILREKLIDVMYENEHLKTLNFGKR